MTRVEEEIALVRSAYPELEVQADNVWARIPKYPTLNGLWRQSMIEVAFQFPPNLPGQQPYGFWVRPGLELAEGGAINNYTYPVETPFGPDFGQFSWAPEVWLPQNNINAGTNMLDFVHSFARRLGEGA
jgi:hypothetical protein